MKFIIYIVTLMSILTWTAHADSTTDFRAGDASMNDAMDEARGTLDVFLRNVLDAKGEADYEASVKVAFDVEDGSVSTEYLWVGPFTTSEQINFKGVVANEPQHLPYIKIGHEVRFTKSQIVDWSIWLSDGQSYGGYTTRVILQVLDTAEAERLRKQMSDPIVPSRWR